MAEYASPENVQRMEALESEWNTAVGTALAKDKNVENVNAYVNYGFSWPEHTFVPETLAGLNGDGGAQASPLRANMKTCRRFLRRRSLWCRL